MYKRLVFNIECDLSSLLALGDVYSDILIQNAGIKICIPESK